jgi:hypothetical protein
MEFIGTIDNFDGLVARKREDRGLYELQAFTTAGEFPNACLAGLMVVGFNFSLLSEMKPVLDKVTGTGKLRITVEAVE